MLLDHLQEADDHLRGRADKHLALTSLLGVVNALKSVSKNRRTSHCRMLVYQSVEQLSPGAGLINFCEEKRGTRVSGHEDF